MMLETHDGGSVAAECVVAAEWTRSRTLALSDARCVKCDGVGLIRGRYGVTACGCVRRRICRTVVAKMLQILQEQGGKASSVTDRTPQSRVFTYSRPREEFLADAFLIARRSLAPDEYDCFRFAMLLGADWKLMCRRLRLDRGNYYHLLYRTEEKLGLAWAETAPYPLWPICEYFGNRKVDAEAARTGD